MKSDERNGADPRTVGVAEKTRRSKRSAAASHVVPRLDQRADNEPKHAADLAQKAAALDADFLHHQYRIGLECFSAFSLCAFVFGHGDGKLP